jgi:transcriptional regulator with XRE-family HTH domain
VVTLRDLVRDRLKALGLKQQDLAALLGIDPSTLSNILTGRSQPSLERAAEWVKSLVVTGDAEAELLDALHLAAASERVRALVDRLQAERAIDKPLLARYRDRVGEVLYILDHVEPGPTGGRPPPTHTSQARFVELVEALVAERNRIVHGIPIDQPATPPAPNAPSDN